ncbi:hypothetical protein ACFFUT_08600 [Pseudohalocynthiibacter aestuariivivens]|uniref:Uncharacterized protein n=1 Tax=Pseudohalocynthiibacter aestuariivivens TaxID=1591409 RepID=A0ABV5JGL1_9RHOB|nr:hypothetical protein [Pseudohalocynthiibacter aestuariivivens]MBS9717034.1 hypothetical protein [Pseudohalocynthiibacter aestuariivivens]
MKLTMYQLYCKWFHLSESIVRNCIDSKLTRLRETEDQIAELRCVTIQDYAIKVMLVHDNSDIEMPPIERSLVRDALLVLSNIRDDEAKKDEEAPA